MKRSNWAKSKIEKKINNENDCWEKEEKGNNEIGKKGNWDDEIFGKIDILKKGEGKIW